MEKRLKPAGPDIVFEEFDGDLVVLNLATGRYFGFNPAAATLWRALVMGVSPTDLMAALPQGAGFAAFVAALHENALVVETSDPTVAIDASLRALVAALDVAPVLEVYDDLSDLIVADPIHDADESQGWPVRPPQG